MAWNEPGKGGQDKDPWGNKGGRDQGPPDLDEAIRNVSRRLGGIFGGSGGSGASSGGFSAGIIGLVLVVAVIVWALSGFYTIREAERGVVLRFGAYHEEVQPGLHWRPVFIDDYIAVDVSTTQSMPSRGNMLTRDENVVRVEMEVQFRVVDPRAFLFSVPDPYDTLKQATDSALRYVVGHARMDDVLSEGREQVRQDTWKELEKIIENYGIGITIRDVNFQNARPPQQVRDAFDDAVAAREDEERIINKARAYAREKEPQARGHVERMLEEAEGYKQKVTLEAQGEVAQFEQMLPQYQAAPEVTRSRLYIEMMQSVLSNTSKVLVDVEGGNNIMYLPLEKMMQQRDNARSPSSGTPPMVIDSSVSDNAYPEVNGRTVRDQGFRQGRN
ncbi:FtsH protease activity modulator HflK [Corallincola holothuriorum]|uniref:Protein HflK n=1 Tax=Corallincola holothuriorum TaxID=2282215 RepID=A0A368NQG6_9GAMM|nr:FtsH protease activity modulator HflK [Corallincola holothuriorum]RCU51511.1 FtsH protease activity modulator HflK [Corallincola holothuriorum]